MLIKMNKATSQKYINCQIAERNSATSIQFLIISIHLAKTFMAF